MATKFCDVGVDFFAGQDVSSDRVIQNIRERADANHVSEVILSARDLKSSKKALDIARKYDGWYSMVGVHPQQCSDWSKTENPETYTDSLCSLLDRGIKEEKVVAIGEIGLDFTNEEERHIQVSFLNPLFVLAKNYDLPLVVRIKNSEEDSTNEFFQELDKNLLEQEDHTFKGVIQSFTGSKSDLDQILSHGFYVGVSGDTLWKTQSRELISSIPPNKVILQTRSPHGHIDGGWGTLDRVSTEPRDLPKLAHQVAELYGIDQDILTSQVARNVRSLFFSNVSNE